MRIRSKPAESLDRQSRDSPSLVCPPYLLSTQDSRVLSGQSRPGAAHGSSVTPGSLGDGTCWHRGRWLAWGGDQASWRAPLQRPPSPRCHLESGPPAHSDAICREGFEAGRAVAGDTGGGRLLLESVSLPHSLLRTHVSSVALGSFSPSLSFSRCKGDGVCWVVGPEGPALGDRHTRHTGPVQHPARSVDRGLQPTGEQLCLLVGRSGAGVPEKPDALIRMFSSILSGRLPRTAPWFHIKGLKTGITTWWLPGQVSCRSRWSGMRRPVCTCSRRPRATEPWETGLTACGSRFPGSRPASLPRSLPRPLRRGLHGAETTRRSVC